MTRPAALIGIALLTAFLGAGCATRTTPHEDRLLDGGWRFMRADAAGASSPDFDDRNWQPVHLPHTWNILLDRTGAPVGLGRAPRGHGAA